MSLFYLLIPFAIAWGWWSWISHGVLNRYAISKIIFSAIVILAFQPLFLGFLIPFLNAFFTKGNVIAFLSFLLFTGFVVCYVAKLLIQANLILKIHNAISNYKDLNNPEVQKMLVIFKISYKKVIIYSPLIIIGLIPVIQLLTIWIAVPSAIVIQTVYAEKQFYEDMSNYLSKKSENPVVLPLGFFYIILKANAIFSPLLLVALATGIMSLGST